MKIDIIKGVSIVSINCPSEERAFSSEEIFILVENSANGIGYNITENFN